MNYDENKHLPKYIEVSLLESIYRSNINREHVTRMQQPS